MSSQLIEQVQALIVAGEAIGQPPTEVEPDPEPSIEEMAKLGSGARFKALAKKIGSRGGVRDPDAVAAAIGRKKWGAKRMVRMAAAGHK